MIQPPRQEIARATNTTAATTLILTVEPGKDMLTGNSIILRAMSNGRAVVSVTDSKSNVYIIDAVAGTNADAVQTSVARCHNAIPLVAGDTITVTYSGSIGTRIALADEWIGLANEAPHLVTLQPITNGSTVTTPSAPSTVADLLLLGMFGLQASAGSTVFTPTAPYTALAELGVSGAPANRTLVAEYQIVNTIGTYNASGALTVGGAPQTRNYTGVFLAYKAAPMIVEQPDEDTGGVAGGVPATFDLEFHYQQPSRFPPQTNKDIGKRTSFAVINRGADNQAAEMRQGNPDMIAVQFTTGWEIADTRRLQQSYAYLTLAEWDALDANNDNFLHSVPKSQGWSQATRIKWPQNANGTGSWFTNPSRVQWDNQMISYMQQQIANEPWSDGWNIDNCACTDQNPRVRSTNNRVYGIVDSRYTDSTGLFSSEGYGRACSDSVKRWLAVLRPQFPNQIWGGNIFDPTATTSTFDLYGVFDYFWRESDKGYSPAQHQSQAWLKNMLNNDTRFYASKARSAIYGGILTKLNPPTLAYDDPVEVEAMKFGLAWRCMSMPTTKYTTYAPGKKLPRTMVRWLRHAGETMEIWLETSFYDVRLGRPIGPPRETMLNYFERDFERGKVIADIRNKPNYVGTFIVNAPQPEPITTNYYGNLAAVTTESGNLTGATDAWNEVTDTSITLDNTRRIKGVYSTKWTASTMGTARRTVSPVPDLFFSFYVYLAQQVTQEFRFVQVSNDGTTQGSLHFRASGALQLSRFNGGFLGVASPVLAANTLYRVGFRQKAGTGANGVLEWYLAVGDAPFTTPIASVTTDTNTLATATQRVAIGFTSTGATLPLTFWIDNLRIDSRGLPIEPPRRRKKILAIGTNTNPGGDIT